MNQLAISTNGPWSNVQHPTIANIALKVSLGNILRCVEASRLSCVSHLRSLVNKAENIVAMATVETANYQTGCVAVEVVAACFANTASLLHGDDASSNVVLPNSDMQ